MLKRTADVAFAFGPAAVEQQLPFTIPYPSPPSAPPFHTLLSLPVSPPAQKCGPPLVAADVQLHSYTAPRPPAVPSPPREEKTSSPEVASSAQPPRKRKVHIRTTTGCRQCRTQRVKCPEGPVGPDGVKVACRRCWETDRPCYYPAKGFPLRGRGREQAWERAKDVDQWGVSDASTGSGASGSGSTSGSAADGECDVKNEDPLDFLDWANISAASGSTGSNTASIILPLDNTNQLALVPQNLQCSVSVSSASEASPPTLSSSLVDALANPCINRLLSTFTLASLSQTEMDRKVVSYFEFEGCHEIVSSMNSKQNWIFAQLFPRIFATLSLPASGSGFATTAIREWMHMCLLHLAYVHRGNIECDPVKVYQWKAEAAKCRQKASCAILRARVRCPEGQWKTEEYLAGFFTRCMADMLDGKAFTIDASCAFELPLASASSFYPSLRDLIAMYATVQLTCTPLEDAASVSPTLELPSEGPEWVERFVGFSRRVILLIGKVNTMVVKRAAMIRAGTQNSLAGQLLRSEAERMVGDLGENWDWNETVHDLGKSERIQRGNEVIRSALCIMLLSEVLNVDLSDSRVTSATARVIELVADADPAGISGFQWPLTIVACYTRDVDTRQRLLDIAQYAIALSFGKNYQGPGEILRLCWEVLDSEGRYEHGIAPWREAASALGRNLFL